MTDEDIPLDELLDELHDVAVSERTTDETLPTKTMTPLAAKLTAVRHHNAALIAMLKDLRRFTNQLWLDCVTEGIAEETLARYRGIGTRLNSLLKTGTDG